MKENKDPIKNSPKVSVIMPMYKCSDFVDGALDLVCDQTFRDIEIICVLDGPDEKIRRIVEKRIETDGRITLLEQEHGGAGTARNTGMDIARGDYFLFLDADDLFEPNMVERLYEEAVRHDADTVMCSYVQTDEWTKRTQRGFGYDYSKYMEGVVTDCTQTDDLIESFVATTWNKLFRRKMLADKKLRFSSTRIQNDVFFVTIAMCCTKRLIVIKEDLLTVRRHINEDSISSNRSKYSEDAIVVLEDMYRWFRENGYWKKRRSDYYYAALTALHYQAGFGYNEKFEDGVAHMLSKEHPWKRMCNAEVIQVLDMRIGKLKTEKQHKIDEMQVFKDSDNSGRKQVLHVIENRINAFRKIRSIMKNKYGRDITKRDKPIAWLSWSVRYRGLGGTVRRIREKMQGEIVIEIVNAICAGHITASGHYITFFIPKEVYRETAYMEDLSVTVRCNGYYPIAVSGKKKDVFTMLGPRRIAVINGGTSTRSGEVMRAHAEVSPGLGIFVQLRFEEALLKNRQGGPADNNQPVSVQISGKIKLK